MEAPLGTIVRKILNNQDASKKLMQQIILGERLGVSSNSINLEDKTIKIHRVASLNSSDEQKLKK
jgi:hypothetical protein